MGHKELPGPPRLIGGSHEVSKETDAAGYVKSHVIGIPKRFEAYTSASLMVYDASMDIQYVIEAKHGKDITKWNPGEKEILFKRDTWFIPTRIEGNTIYMKEVYDE